MNSSKVANGIGIIPGTTICGFSDGAAWPVKNAINKYRSDFEEWINSGRKSTLVSLKMKSGH